MLFACTGFLLFHHWENESNGWFSCNCIFVTTDCGQNDFQQVSETALDHTFPHFQVFKGEKLNLIKYISSTKAAFPASRAILLLPAPPASHSINCDASCTKIICQQIGARPSPQQTTKNAIKEIEMENNKITREICASSTSGNWPETLSGGAKSEQNILQHFLSLEAGGCNVSLSYSPARTSTVFGARSGIHWEKREVKVEVVHLSGILYICHKTKNNKLKNYFPQKIR